MAFDIYEIYRRVGPFFRRKRQRRFVETFRPGPDTTVLDVGGYWHFWRELPVQPRITLLNVDGPPPPGELPPGFIFMQGDGRKLPFPDQSFDIAFSNSVIEHVGTLEDQKNFAAEVRRVGRSVWVQTPNRGFPVEPHFIGPTVPGLPRLWQRELLRWGSVRGWLRRRDHADFDALFDEVRLLTEGEFRELFPDCQIEREKLCGITKSFIAARAAASPEAG